MNQPQNKQSNWQSIIVGIVSALLILYAESESNLTYGFFPRLILFAIGMITVGLVWISFNKVLAVAIYVLIGLILYRLELPFLVMVINFVTIGLGALFRIVWVMKPENNEAKEEDEE